MMNIFPKHACQYCGSESKFVETIIDDRFVWNGEEFEACGFEDEFIHTGEETCAECGKKWTGK